MARFGFTTGSCAAAAAKAAAYMLLTGKVKNEISIITPKGITFNAQITDIIRSERKVSCSVIKDGGDDPDVTTGSHIVAEVSFAELSIEKKAVNGEGFEDAESKATDTDVIFNEAIDDSCKDDGCKKKSDSYEDKGILNINKSVLIDGGEGVGRVTKPGLDQPVGNAAINSVPRKMIEEEVSEVINFCDYKGCLSVLISVPEGRDVAKKTFNERLGIIGGISILGTSGIVEPMSDDALIATIRTELNQKKALLWDYVPVSPGNYGLDFMKRSYGFNLDESVKCSNFVGECIDMVCEIGFKGMLFTGHIGKLVKIAGGMMNTHSKYGDKRMKVINECIEAVIARKEYEYIDDAVKEKISRINNIRTEAEELKRIITDCVATEDAVDILDDFGRKSSACILLFGNDEYYFRNLVMNEVMRRITNNIYMRQHNGFFDEKSDSKSSPDLSVKGCIIECMMYSNKHGMLAKSGRADELLNLIINR